MQLVHSLIWKQELSLPEVTVPSIKQNCGRGFLCGFEWSNNRFILADDFYMVVRRWILSLHHSFVCVCVSRPRLNHLLQLNWTASKIHTCHLPIPHYHISATQYSHPIQSETLHYPRTTNTQHTKLKAVRTHTPNHHTLRFSPSPPQQAVASHRRCLIEMRQLLMRRMLILPKLYKSCWMTL